MRSGQSLDTTRTCELGAEEEEGGTYTYLQKCGASLKSRMRYCSIAFERRQQCNVFLEYIGEVSPCVNAHTVVPELAQHVYRCTPLRTKHTHKHTYSLLNITNAQPGLKVSPICAQRVCQRVFAPWTLTTSHGQARPMSSQAGTQDSKVERTVVCSIDLFREIIRRQVVSLLKAGGVPANMPEFLSWTQNTTALTQQLPLYSAKTGEPTLVVPCPCGCKEFSHKGSKEHFVRSTCRIRGTVRKRASYNDWITRRATYTGERYIESIVELTLILLCVRSTIAGSASSSRDGVLVHRVLRTRRPRSDNSISRRGMMLEHVSLLSNGHNKQSTMLQLHLDCV